MSVCTCPRLHQSPRIPWWPKWREETVHWKRQSTHIANTVNTSYKWWYILWRKSPGNQESIDQRGPDLVSLKDRGHLGVLVVETYPSLKVQHVQRPWSVVHENLSERLWLEPRGRRGLSLVRILAFILRATGSRWDVSCRGVTRPHVCLKVTWATAWRMDWSCGKHGIRETGWIINPGSTQPFCFSLTQQRASAFEAWLHRQLTAWSWGETCVLFPQVSTSVKWEKNYSPCLTSSFSLIEYIECQLEVLYNTGGKGTAGVWIGADYH